MTSVTFTYPLELIRVRMAFHSRIESESATRARPSFLRAMSHIYHEGATSRTISPSNTISKRSFEYLPILKFYRGFTVSMVGMIPYAGTSFLTWDFLRAHFYPRRDHTLNDLALLRISLSAPYLAQFRKQYLILSRSYGVACKSAASTNQTVGLDGRRPSGLYIPLQG